jgi:NAD(P)-dependent dehydrogenase (short-subunit alcohol dehydrogenase family)
VGLLDGKIAIVTGAGHGIGRAHVLELARQGARVVVNDLGTSVTGQGTGRDADETVALVEKLGGEAVANYGDVSDHEQCAGMVQQAVDTWGRLDILVNNAGIVRDGAVWNMKVEDFDAVMAVHVRGTWSCSHHAAVHWRTRSKSGEKVVGRIVNTTSGAGLTGNFGQSSYATAKAAIVGLTLTLAQELRSCGVTVNAVGPSGATRITGTMPGAPPVSRWTRPTALPSSPGWRRTSPNWSPARCCVPSTTG